MKLYRNNKLPLQPPITGFPDKFKHIHNYEIQQLIKTAKFQMFETWKTTEESLCDNWSLFIQYISENRSLKCTPHYSSFCFTNALYHRLLLFRNPQECLLWMLYPFQLQGFELHPGCLKGSRSILTNSSKGPPWGQSLCRTLTSVG